MLSTYGYCKNGFFKGVDVEGGDADTKPEGGKTDMTDCEMTDKSKLEHSDPEDPRQKAIDTLEILKKLGAAEPVIKAAQAQVDAHPAPRPAQAIRMGARVSQILAQHLEARETRLAKQQELISALTAQRDTLNVQIAKLVEVRIKEDEEAALQTTEIKKAIIKAQNMAGENEDDDVKILGNAQALAGCTTADIVQQALAAQLQRMEKDPRFASNLDAIRCAFSETVALSAMTVQRILVEANVSQPVTNSQLQGAAPVQTEQQDAPA